MKERDIEDQLEINLDKIEDGLILIERQKRTEIGIIDLFCKDNDDNYVIIEIKRNPSPNVIAQLAKYNMALIKEGVCKNKLRTILVAPNFSKAVENTCEFFNFETKIIPKKIIPYEKEKLNNSFSPSDIKKLIQYIKKEEIVNQSMISRLLKIYYHTTLDLVNHLKENNLINLTSFGGNKVISLKES